VSVDWCADLAQSTASLRTACVRADECGSGARDNTADLELLARSSKPPSVPEEEIKVAGMEKAVLAQRTRIRQRLVVLFAAEGDRPGSLRTNPRSDAGIVMAVESKSLSSLV
jgi:hypothetical protein